MLVDGHPLLAFSLRLLPRRSSILARGVLVLSLADLGLGEFLARNTVDGVDVAVLSRVGVLLEGVPQLVGDEPLERGELDRLLGVVPLLGNLVLNVLHLGRQFLLRRLDLVLDRVVEGLLLLGCFQYLSQNQL